MERHADEVRARARGARDRVTRASSLTFPAIKSAVAARLSRGTAVRAKRALGRLVGEAPRRAAPPRRAGRRLRRGGAARGRRASRSAVVHPASRPSRDASAHAASAVARAQPSRRDRRRAPPLVGLVSRLAGEVMVDGVRTPTICSRARSAPGTVIATGDGRIDVQFGDAQRVRARAALAARAAPVRRRARSSSSSTARSTSRSRRARPASASSSSAGDAADRGARHAVPRRPRWRAGTRVACRHGLVAVRDHAGEALVGAAQQVDVDQRGRPDAASSRCPPTSSRSSRDATPVTLPLWIRSISRTARRRSRSRAPRRRDVRVDGVELGQAPLRVRVMPGRHTVEAADAAGRFRRAGWVDVARPPRPARLEVAAPSRCRRGPSPHGEPPQELARRDRREPRTARALHARRGQERHRGSLRADRDLRRCRRARSASSTSTAT